MVVGSQDACPSTCPHRDWDRHCGASGARVVGVEPAAGAACFPYLQALVGRVRPGARAAVLGSAVAGAYAGGHLPRGFMKAARPKRPPASPPPPAPPPARTPSPRPVPPCCQGSPCR